MGCYNKIVPKMPNKFRETMGNRLSGSPCFLLGDAFLRRFLSSGRYGEKCAQWVFIFELFYKMSHSVPELELQGAKTFGWSQNEVSAPAPGQTKLVYQI
jgi:hypothetical protein